MNQLLNIGMQRFEIWMDETAMPAAKRKAKKAGENITLFFSALKSVIKGEQPKVLQIIEDEQKKKNAGIQVVGYENAESEEESAEIIEITKAELEKIIALTKRSAVTLVGCINVLKNAAVIDMTPEQKIEFESQLKSLTTEDLMTEIGLLLEERNRDILDATSLAILSAFRDGDFIIEGKKVPIQSFLN